AYQHALAIEKRLAADHPEAAEYQRALAATYDGIGLLDIRADQYEKAQVSLEQGLALWSQLVKSNAQVPENRHGLASVQQGPGTAYGQRGKCKKAEAMLNESASTYQALVADYPDVPEYRHCLGLTYSILRTHYFNNKRQVERAETVNQQAKQI